MDASVARWIAERFAATAGDHIDGRALGQGTTGVLSPTLDACVVAMDYYRGGTVDTEDPFAPQYSFPEVGTYPPPLEHVPAELVELWKSALDGPLPALLEARIGHLLWICNTEGRFPAVVRAIAAYLKLAGNAERTLLERADDASCALTLAIRISSAESTTSAVTALTTIADECLGHPDEPGACLTALGALVAMRQGRPAETEALLQRAQQLYVDPFLTADVLGLRSIVASGAEAKREIAVELVQNWIDAAASRPGIVAQANLQKALEAAHAAGLSGERERVLLLLQELDTTADLHEVSAMVEIPREKWDAWINLFVDWPNSPQALGAFATYVPVERDRAVAEASVRQAMSDHPLQYLVTLTIADRFGVPLRTVSTPEAHFDVAFDQQEAMRLGIWSETAIEVLRRIDERWPNLRDTPEQAFPSPGLPEGSAAVFGEGLRLHLQGNARAAVCILIPEIEAVLRHWARTLGYATHEVNRVGEPRLRGMGALLRDLRRHLPEHEWRYLDLALVNVLGLNLRNNAMHGVVAEYSPQESAIAVHICLVLGHRLLRTPNNPGEDSASEPTDTNG